MTMDNAVCIIFGMNGVCITGNRPHKLPFAEDSFECEWLKKRIREEVVRLIGEGYTRFISGMAQGLDTYFAECILELKKEYDITLEAAVPYPKQSAAFSPKERERYNRIIVAADKTVVLCNSYTPYCFHLRNRYMVDNSDVVITACFVHGGGAAYTARYAEKKNKKIINLNAR